MQNLIQLLPDHIANQIAAGEVIQRPASVVKEMIENAIDAGSNKIQVIIKDAGKTLIQIIDNGNGMSSGDALMCFERHATSKVRKADDLFALTTKGFRGEALASIAAIAHVTLKTKRAENEVATKIQIEGSKVVCNEACVSSEGTSFEVKNLFYNVPARRNFLKSDNVEFRHIVDEFERVALAHPDITFTLHHNEQEIYHLPSTVLRKRIVNILGKNTNDRLVPIEESTDIVKINGYVLKPEFARKTRGEQFLFVNQRFFKDSYFNHAITKAFEGLIQSKLYPGYFLYLEIDPSKIDVNVHPTKTEIKFEEDRSIYAILFSSIRQALGKYNIAPSLDFERETSFDLPMSKLKEDAIEPVIRVNPEYNPFQSFNAQKSSSNKAYSSAINAQGFGKKENSESDWQSFYQIKEEEVTADTSLFDLSSVKDISNSFAFKGKYMITACKSGFLVIDCARAHERILFDEMHARFISSPIQAQALLFPVEKEFSKDEKVHWINSKTILERLGFEGEFEDNILHLSAVPASLQEESSHPCIDMILEKISYKDVDKGDLAHLIISSVAQAYGRQKSRITDESAAQHLVETLFQSEEHAVTPQGKKIIQTLTLEELAEKF